MEPSKVLELRKSPEKSQLYKDALTMAMRLMGEEEDSMSPECREVMTRWRPECVKALAASVGRRI